MSIVKKSYSSGLLKCIIIGLQATAMPINFLKNKIMTKLIMLMLLSVVLFSCEKEERGTILGSWVVIDAKMMTEERFQTTAMVYYMTYELFDENQHTACLLASGFSALVIDNVAQFKTKWTFDDIGEFFIDDQYLGNFNGGTILTQGTARRIYYYFEDGNLHITYPDSYGMQDFPYPRVLSDGTVIPRGRYTIYGHPEIVFKRVN